MNTKFRLAIFLSMVGGITMAATQSTITSPLKPQVLKAKADRLIPVELSVSTESMPPKEKQALEKIVRAAKYMDPIYLRQVWSENVAWKEKLEQSGEVTLQRLFRQNVGPWLRMDKNEPFLNGVPKEKPAGAGFYPDDMTKEEFQRFVEGLSKADKEKATGFFTVIQRGKDGKLRFVPYSEAYREFLEPSAKLLREAADLTENVTLQKFLISRAKAFSKDDYYESDVAWMDLDAPIDVTIGPYETYEDELFNYKAAFEAFVTIRDDAETEKLEKFSAQLQDIENHLPMAAKYKNPQLGALAPIRVVDQVFSSGEARRGVATAAFNLPNDEKVVKEKGSKRVMLKNVQLAKFSKVLIPISEVVLSKADQKKVEFDAFFTHILMHELAHGIGPHEIKVGKETSTVRKELKELYSAIEEAKADITGLFALQYLMDKGVIDRKMQSTMYTTFLASTFRSVRFGITEAHGKGVALQFNYLTEKGGIQFNPKTSKFSINASKIQKAVEELTSEILTLQAEGSYAKAQKLLEKYAVVKPAMQKALDKLNSVPVDIEPSYPIEQGLKFI